MTCKLSVNVNAVAFLRNRRDLPWPSVLRLSQIALEAGAYGITVHPRPDERHVRRGDVFDLVELIRSRFQGKEFNIEGYPEERWLKLVEEAKPDQATLVPDDPSQSTSDHGWDIAANEQRLREVSERMAAAGARVSLFIDADARQAERAATVGAARVEIYTGPYGGAFDPAGRAVALARIKATGDAASAAGLVLNAGHDLTCENLPPLVAALPQLAEVSIGHAIIAEALEFGMAQAVRRFRAACGDPV